MDKYKIIYADCPWIYKDNKGNDSKMGGITYKQLLLQELKALPVQNIADENCALFMWATMPLLQEALEVISSWGFIYTTCAFSWVKTNSKNGGIYSGLGHWVNGNIELCLFAKKGKPVRIKKNIKQIVFSPLREHSRKPDEVRDRIVSLLGDIPRIELFARYRAEGWDATGLELDGIDIRDFLGEEN